MTTASSSDARPRWLWRFVSWLAENVAFISWHKHWKGVYLHCIHPRYCVRLYLWGCDWHLKAKYALREPANNTKGKRRRCLPSAYPLVMRFFDLWRRVRSHSQPKQTREAM